MDETSEELELPDEAHESSDIDALLDETIGTEDEPESPVESPQEDKPADVTPEQEKLATEPLADQQTPVVRTLEEIEREAELIEVPKNAHPNIKKAVPVLRGNLKEVSAIARANEQRAVAAEQKLAERENQPLPEEVAHELEDLRKFRLLRSIEDSPEIKDKYDTPIEKLNTESIELLDQLGLTDKVKDYIVKNGGVVALRYSQKMMPNGEETQAEWFEKQILGNVESPQQKADIEDNIYEARKLLKAKQAALEGYKNDAASYEKEQEEKFKAEAKARAEKAEQIANDITKGMGNQASFWEIKPEATPAEKEYAEWHNSSLASCMEEAKKMYNPNADPVTEVPKCIAAAQFIYQSQLSKRLSDELIAVQGKLKTAEDRIGKISSSGRTARQSNAPITEKKKTPNADLLDMSDSNAFDKMFDEMTAER